MTMKVRREESFSDYEVSQAVIFHDEQSEYCIDANHYHQIHEFLHDPFEYYLISAHGLFIIYTSQRFMELFISPFTT